MITSTAYHDPLWTDMLSGGQGRGVSVFQLPVPSTSGFLPFRNLLSALSYPFPPPVDLPPTFLSGHPRLPNRFTSASQTAQTL